MSFNPDHHVTDDNVTRQIVQYTCWSSMLKVSKYHSFPLLCVQIISSRGTTRGATPYLSFTLVFNQCLFLINFFGVTYCYILTSREAKVITSGFITRYGMIDWFVWWHVDMMLMGKWWFDIDISACTFFVLPHYLLCTLFPLLKWKLISFSAQVFPSCHCS